MQESTKHKPGFDFNFEYYSLHFGEKSIECKISAKFEYVIDALIQLQCTQEIFQFG